MKKFFTYFSALFPLLFLTIILWACGGGGGGGGGPTTSTFTGSVSGTLILAVDENGTIVAKDDTAGKTPDSFGNFPFSLTVPGGHEYTIYFVLPSENRTVWLVSGFGMGANNIYSVTAGATIDLGYVDTAGGIATAENDPLAVAGVTSGGFTGPDTITVEASNPMLYLMDRSDVGIKYRTQVQVKNPDGSVLANGELVKDVVVYDPNWQELPMDGSFYYWDGLSMNSDIGSGPVPTPTSDIEAYLVATAGTLPDGFYSELITDSNRNLHLVKFWHEQPTEVAKPTNLAQVVNLDNSITLTWTNPAGIAGPDYVLRLEIRHSDENGDGLSDIALLVSLNAAANSYTIPASFVSSNLAGKQNLIWRVQVRQVAGSILFPDGSTRTVQIYRNYSEDQPLSVGPSTAIPFTPDMLTGKVFAFSEIPPDVSMIEFLSDGITGIEYDLYSDVFEMFSFGWSIDGNGRLLVDYAPTVITVTLLAETATYLDVQVDDGFNPVYTDRLTKTIPFDQLQVPGIYSDGVDISVTFVDGGTGTLTDDQGTTGFTWSVDFNGVLIMTSTPPAWERDAYLLAGSTADTLNITGIERDGSGTPVGAFAVTLLRQ